MYLKVFTSSWKSLWCSFSPLNCYTRQLVQITLLCCWTVMRLSPVQSERKGATEILSLECRSVVPRQLSKFHKAFAKESSDEIPRLLFVYKSRKQRRATLGRSEARYFWGCCATVWSPCCATCVMCKRERNSVGRWASNWDIYFL